jgi:hypothetical protein
LAAFLIGLFGAVTVRRREGSSSLFSFHLVAAETVVLPAAGGPLQLRIHPALIILATCVASIASLASFALPGETPLPDPNALLFQANNVVMAAQQQAESQVRQAQDESLRMISNAEHGLDPLSIYFGGTEQPTTSNGKKRSEIQADPAIAEQAKRIGDQRTRWAQELGKRNIEEANKRAELLRAQAGRLQAEIDRTGHTKKNYSANFLNALLLGIMLIGFLGMASRSIGIPVHDVSGYLASGIVAISFSLTSIINGESQVLKSCEALLIAAVLFASSRQSLSARAAVLNAFRILSQRVVPAVKALVACSFLAAVVAVIIDGIVYLFTIVLSRPSPALYFNPSETYWRSHLLDILNMGSDLTIGFLGTFFSCIAGALFLSSLRPDDQSATASLHPDPPPLHSIVYRSFFSRRLYSKALNFGGFGGPKYLLLLVVLVSIPELIVLQAKFGKFLDSEATPFAKQITPLEITDTGVSIPDDAVTYRLKTSPGGRVLALVNTGENDLEPGDRDSFVDVYDNALVLRLVGIPIIGWALADESDGTVTSGQRPDVTIDNEDLAVWIRTARRWLILAIAPIWIACSYLHWLALCVLIAWAGPLFLGSRQKSLSFYATLRVATMAATPAVIVELVTSPFSLSGSIIRAILIGICIGYFCFGLSSVEVVPTVPDVREPQPASA